MDQKVFAVRHLLTKATYQSQAASGFTIVELIIVVLVTGILIGLLFGPLDDLYMSNNRGLQSSIVTSDVNSTLQTIRQTASISYSFDDSNTITDPVGTLWTGSSNVLITSNYVTSTDLSGTKMLLKGGAGCSPLFNQYVFFVKDKILYRRTLTSKGITSVCGSGDWDQKQTCAATTSLTTYPRCKATDAKLLSNIDTFKIDYYTSSSGNTTTTPGAAKAVSVTITVKNKNSSKPITSKMRIKRTNGS